MKTALVNSRIDILNKEKSIVGLTFEGRVDAAGRDVVKAQLHAALASASTVVVDMKLVPFIDSSGLSAIVSGLRLARENNKEIVLAGLNKQARMVFNLTMMDRVFSIYPTVEIALNNLPD